MKEIPGENHQIERNREDRREAPGRGPDSPPTCCHCGRELGPGIRFSWTKDARLQCAACSGPKDTLETFI